MFKSKRVLVIGYGISGKAAASFLLSQGCAVLAVDKKAKEFAPEAGVELCEDTIGLPKDVSQVILSPGVSPSHPLVQEALRRGIEVIGEIELAFRHIHNRMIGVTGSNGKTTTVLQIAHILNRSHVKARALGNVGVGLCSYLLNPDPEEILVVELSSFQLETLQEKKLDVAVILNILPNHLDRYRSMEEYAAAKLRIQACVKEGGQFFTAPEVAQEYGSQVGKWEAYDLRKICRRFGVTDRQFEEGLIGFQKPPHRIEWVAEIHGVRYYNDSKSSNVDAAMYAVRQLEGPLIVVVGGTDKGSSYKPWIEAFYGKVKRVVAYGAAAAKIEADLAGALPFERRGLFAEAIWSAREAAGEGDTVLLSPGCSSYDQFKNFEHRGDVFKNMVKEWEEQWIEKKQSL